MDWFLYDNGLRHEGVKSSEVTLNLKYRTEKLKTKNRKNRNMKNQITERRKPSFTKRIARKCRLI